MKLLYFLLFFVYLPVIIFSQNQNRLNVREFYENPFLSNVILPQKFFPYNSYEELFGIIGIPINRTRLFIHEYQSQKELNRNYNQF